MDKNAARLKLLERYIVLNSVILCIASAFGGYGTNVIINWIPNTILSLIFIPIMTILSFIGFPGLLIVSTIVPALGDMERRLTGTLIGIGFVFLVLVLFELLRRFVKSIREKSLYSEEAFKYVTFITWNLGAIFISNWIVSYIVALRNILFVPGGIYVNGGFSVFDYVLLVPQVIPVFGVLLIIGLILLRKTYRDAIELKKDNELTV